MLDTLKRNTLPTLLALAAALALTGPPAALADDGDTAAESADRRIELAPPGACAQRRGLPQAAQPASFDITGPPADKLSPAQVATELRVASTAVPVPPTPPPPGPGLCDDPAACSSPGTPVFVESEPVPGLPPGLRP